MKLGKRDWIVVSIGCSVGLRGGCLEENKNFSICSHKLFPYFSFLFASNTKKLHSTHQTSLFLFHFIGSWNLLTVLILIFSLPFAFCFLKVQIRMEWWRRKGKLQLVERKTLFGNFSRFFLVSFAIISNFTPNRCSKFFFIFFGPLTGNWLHDIITSRNIRAQCGKSRHKKIPRDKERKKVFFSSRFWWFPNRRRRARRVPTDGGGKRKATEMRRWKHESLITIAWKVQWERVAARALSDWNFSGTFDAGTGEYELRYQPHVIECKFHS